MDSAIHSANGVSSSVFTLGMEKNGSLYNGLTEKHKGDNSLQGQGLGWQVSVNNLAIYTFPLHIHVNIVAETNS